MLSLFITLAISANGEVDQNYGSLEESGDSAKPWYGNNLRPATPGPADLTKPIGISPGDLIKTETTTTTTTTPYIPGGGGGGGGGGGIIPINPGGGGGGGGGGYIPSLTTEEPDYSKPTQPEHTKPCDHTKPWENVPGVINGSAIGFIHGSNDHDWEISEVIGMIIIPLLVAVGIGAYCLWKHHRGKFRLADDYTNKPQDMPDVFSDEPVHYKLAAKEERGARGAPTPAMQGHNVPTAALDYTNTGGSDVVWSPQ